MLQHLVALLLLTVCTNAATVTVFDVFPTADDGSTGDPLTDISLSPLGVGNDGATTYDFAEAISPTETVHAVIVAGATQIHLSAATPFPLVRDCSWENTSGEGVCSFFDPGVTAMQTFTGRVTPLFTLTVDDSIVSRPTSDASAQGTPTSSASQTNSAIKLGSAVGFGSVVVVLACGFFR
ncbi:hypothetical protein PLEOSDRAFT_162923 [Pleurotus ostreatus PC15]|uniref:Uncharacterized protein n=1 Tax=Pleurotus ostreatus (strain PC15) TaxID=1137138 RepID=A0A067N5C8_PLEO1|nr:hypothetical protein PLEOSDRAFT_162923 [Pleurotus ostreatus PC15]